ncbi:hypothetical protein BJ912DRAFT_295352 [Pholiota molesta]|nr:hypothetical protein BJ912DRAFT_295352 [Pholiota molesta]
MIYLNRLTDTMEQCIFCTIATGRWGPSSKPFSCPGLVGRHCTSRTLYLVPFSSTCDILETPHDVVYIMAAVIITQVVLLFLTVAKRRVASGASPVVHIVVHDGARVFVLIVSMWVTIVPYSLFIQVSKPHIIFVWPIVLMSIGTCRLIMHMQKLPLEVLARENYRNPGATDDASIILTSYIATFESFHAAAGLGLESRQLSLQSLMPLQIRCKRGFLTFCDEHP